MNVLTAFRSRIGMRAAILVALPLCLVPMSASASAQTPSDAQTKKELTGAKTVSVILGKPGKVEWSTTYKKYMWTRTFTAKLRTDTPDVFVIVKGYAAYDVVGGKYTFWRTFTTSNSYEGIPDPTTQEVLALIEKFGRKQILGASYQNAVGEIEVLRLVDEPKFMWHTPNSVSFDVVAVFREKTSYTEVQRVERLFNIRLYRDQVAQPWARILSVAGATKVLETKTYTANEVRLMQGPTKP